MIYASKQAAGILFTDGERILLLKRSLSGSNPNSWDLPGGKSQEFETAIETATREAKEELGIKDVPGKKFNTIHHEGSQKKYTTFFFKVSKEFEVKLNKEHTEYGWFNLDELKSLKIHPKLNKNIDSYMSKIKTSKTFVEWIKSKTFD